MRLMDFQNRYAERAGEVVGRNVWRGWKRDHILSEENLEQLPFRIVAEGDSWFHYSRVLSELAFNIKTPIMNLSDSGDNVRASTAKSRSRDVMSSDRHLERLGRVLQNAQFGCGDWNLSVRFQALLFSGGGNDLVDAADQLIRSFTNKDNAEQIVNRAKLKRVLREVIGGYEKITDFAFERCKGIKVFVHQYDRPQRVGVGAEVMFKRIGPWYKPILDFKCQNGDCDISLAKEIVGYIVEELASEVEKFAKKDSNVVLVQTLDTLKNPSHWEDELHPSKGGSARIAKKFEQALIENLTRS